MSTHTQTWALVREWCGTLSDLAAAAALASWDRETLMPAGGVDGRARLLGTLAGLHHRELVRGEIAEALAALAGDEANMDADQRALVRLATREQNRAVRLPERLVRETSEATSRAVAAWMEARRRDDFAPYAEPLSRVIALKRETAQALADGGDPYDALLDDYEPGAQAAELEPVFGDLIARLAPIVAEATARHTPSLPEREWATDDQLALAHELADMLGFDRANGLIATSEHPFTTTIHRGDVRFTTRLDSRSPLGNIGAVLHEAGHALYEQGFPTAYERTQLFDAPSLGAHESQSRFWENHVGLCAAFWAHIEPTMRRHFPTAMIGIDHELLHRAANAVRPSFIRVEADEVTYNLHIALRFELERALIGGSLTVADLPEAFATRMEDLLGIRPRTATEGALQDIHWADGLIGYFPTYTLGNLYAAQLAQMVDRAIGGLDAAIEQGRFADILAVLRERVHRHGASVPTGDLMRAATGRELSADALIDHLTRNHTAGA